MSAMNLLILTNNPDRASFRQRVLVYLDALSEADIRCQVKILRGGLLTRQKLFKNAGSFDAVFLHKKKLNLFDAFWMRRYCKKIIYNFDDAVMFDEDNPQSDSWSRFISFRRTVRLADMVIVGSPYLAKHAQRLNPNVKVLPIGLKVGDYIPDCPAKDDDKIRLVWIGSASTLSYLEEIKPAIEEIGARFNNVILRIICDEFLELENMFVEKRLWSQDTRGIDLATSDIGLAPLPDNRFTRGKCSFKVLEYSAAGIPVVASPVGTNSVYVREHITGFLAADMQEWIDRIAQLISNPQLREKMGQEGREYARNFDISVIGKQVAELVTKCLQDKLW